MVRKKGKDRDHERLKIDMQFQVHTADDDITASAVVSAMVAKMHQGLRYLQIEK